VRALFSVLFVVAADEIYLISLGNGSALLMLFGEKISVCVLACICSCVCVCVCV